MSVKLTKKDVQRPVVYLCGSTRDGFVSHVKTALKNGLYAEPVVFLDPAFSGVPREEHEAVARINEEAIQVSNLILFIVNGLPTAGASIEAYISSQMYKKETVMLLCNARISDVTPWVRHTVDRIVMPKNNDEAVAWVNEWVRKWYEERTRT
jgi:hypothetical protein